MTGRKGKSGGVRDGAGRPRSKITIRLGDQFHVPMRGLAIVTKIGYQMIVFDIEGERVVMGYQSHGRKPATAPEPKRAAKETKE